MQEILVALTGGLNTSNNPASIDPDQLTEALGLEYRPPRKGLFAVRGRSRYDDSTMTGSRVFGLVYTQFDVSASGTSGSGQRLLAFSGSSAFGMVATGQTATLYTVKSDLTLAATNFADGVHYGNQWFFWNGVDNSWRIAGTNMTASGVHGLNPANYAFTVIATARSGAFASTVNDIGTYELWLTEYLGDSTGSGGYSDVVNPPIESIFTATPLSVNLSATGLMFRVTWPATATAQNGPSNMFWRAYCSMPDGKFPYGFDAEHNIADVILTANGSIDTSFCPIASALGGRAPYPVVQPLGGVGVGANGKPPKPYDMAVFQDSLVIIDVDDRQKIKYSLADNPHAFPSTYYIPFETEMQDTLNALEVCNNALLVFSSTYGYRVDDLPRATDGDDLFSGRSRAKEPFSRHHGCVAPRGTAVFDIFGSGQLCLFVCRDGIHITDGFKTDYASGDIDWAALGIDMANIHRSKLLNNPKYHRVEFYYQTALAYQRLDFYYHPDFLRPSRSGEGFPRLPILGPITVPGQAATVGILNSDWQTWCGFDSTFAGTPAIWLENTGTTDNNQLEPSGAVGAINKAWTTKDFYPFGAGAEHELVNVYTNQSNTTASGSYTLKATFNVDDEQLAFTATSTLDQSLHGVQPHHDLHNRAQQFSIRGQKDDSGAFQELNYLILVVDKAGKLKSAKSAY